MRFAAGLAGVAVAAAVGAAWPAAAPARPGSADVAALQVGLRWSGVYAGDVDGLRGPATAAAVRALQRRARIGVDGVAGPRTRRALGWRGRHRYGSRALTRGARGWDVAALQFKLAWHGFPSGPFDGALGARGTTALVRFQRWAGLPADGIAGPATFRALRRPPARAPVRLGVPVAARVGDRFGPRGIGFHAGLDFPAASGTPVVAAAAGVVAAAGYLDGWGLRVVTSHGVGVATLAAHLSSVAVRPGQPVARGQLLGRVGMTGHATGPHLHLEVLLRGANLDPARALG